jgi:hypothetical protein
MLSLVLRALFSCALGLAIAIFPRFSNLVAISLSLCLSLFISLYFESIESIFDIKRDATWFESRSSRK